MFLDVPRNEVLVGDRNTTACDNLTHSQSLVIATAIINFNHLRRGDIQPLKLKNNFCL
jgi:hypothetical protein